MSEEPITSSAFVEAIGCSNWAAAIKQLDGELEAHARSTNAGQGSSSDAAQLCALLLNRGFCNQRLQLYRKALKDYDAALTAVSGSIEAMHLKGQVLVALKKPQEAVSVWRAALSAATPTTPAALVLALRDAASDPASPAAAVAPQVQLPSVPVSAVAATTGSAGAPQTYAAAAATGTPAASPSRASPSGPPTTSQEMPRSSSGSGGSSSSGTGSSGAGGGGISSGDVAGGGAGGEGAAQPAARRPKPMPIPPTRPAGDEDGVVRLDCAAQQHSSTSAANTLAAAAAAAGLPPSAALNSAIAIQLAVAQINSGKVIEAERILDAVLATHPRELGALVARGTARALRRELPGAIDDFTAAIEVEPRYADTWKRRGQVRVGCVGGVGWV
ncbi:hypothetical protein FOA52_013029 [Chlamydomonas sp. UWO 241]|nr:hypothetical protein FOA52_013029 [Chlamydomonas sp. UWO 241]